MISAFLTESAIAQRRILAKHSNALISLLMNFSRPTELMNAAVPTTTKIINDKKALVTGELPQVVQTAQKSRSMVE